VTAIYVVLIWKMRKWSWVRAMISCISNIMIKK